MSRKFLFALMQLVVTLAAVFILSKTAAANACSEVGHSSLLMAMISGQEQHPELVRLRDKISEADSLNEARTLALTPTAAAIGALKNARFIMPFSEDLRLAETRLADTHLRIAAASTPGQVANEFSGMLAGFDNDNATSVNTHSRIETTNTPDQVVNEFPRMMLAGLDNDKAASLKIGKVGCSYSTGEVIAIVVGLILGIIPGLILLIVLC